ncbi:EpsI family protein [Spiribacter vilamensis]|uniref:EpsI family protein n=1 Tax=Spiribacter vilamensis TaxID=531306 RepID=A0A4Q8CZF5_9GAMM|nr:EpsI family protein [Spiribacter vilamensis]
MVKAVMAAERANALSRFFRRVVAHLSSYWVAWLALAVTAVAMAVGLETGFERLYERWRFSYNHSFLVFPMAAWLAWVMLSRVPVTRVAPSVVGIVGLALSLGIYALFEALDFTLGMQMAVPLVVFAAVAGLLGLSVAAVMMVPVGFLYFTVPVWDLSTGILQDISTAMVSALLRLSDVTAHIDLYYITIPSGTFEIEKGCAGLQYVIVGLILTVFYAMVWLQRWRTRILLVAVAVVFTMIANWIRIYTLILIGHWSQMQHYLIQVSHDEYGWLVFIVAMAPVLWLARRLETREPETAMPRAENPPARASVKAFVVAGGVVAALTAAPALTDAGPEAPPTPRDISAITAPGGEWHESAATPAWSPQFHAPHMQARSAFRAPGENQVDVYIARYLGKQPDSKLLASRNELAPNWRTLRSEMHEIGIGNDRRAVRAMHLESRGDQRLLWSWYVIGGYSTGEAVRAKMLEIPALLGGRRDGAVIAVSAACEGDCDNAKRSMTGFFETHGQQIEAVARGAADSDGRI